jgi:hypothetical protein
LSIASAGRQDVTSKELVYHVRAAMRRGLEHDPEKWIPVSEKIMLKQQAKAKYRIHSKSFRFSWAHPASTIGQLQVGIMRAVSGWGI